MSVAKQINPKAMAIAEAKIEELNDELIAGEEEEEDERKAEALMESHE